MIWNAFYLIIARCNVPITVSTVYFNMFYVIESQGELHLNRERKKYETGCTIIKR